MSAPKPGEVAIVTTADHIGPAGGPYLAFWDAFRKVWVSASSGVINTNSYTATVRPLVVIDAEDREQVERLARAWESQKYAHLNNQPMTLNAYRMQAALREFANPTPPKPDEPTGLGAVVLAARGGIYTRVSDGCWVPTGRGLIGLSWGEFDAVEVLSEGVQP